MIHHIGITDEVRLDRIRWLVRLGLYPDTSPPVVEALVDRLLDSGASCRYSVRPLPGSGVELFGNSE